MPTCKKCGAENGVTDTICASCGESLVDAPTEYHVLRATTNEVLGPLSESRVKDWINEKRITASDSVTSTGNQNWIPILQSPFSKQLVDQMNIERVAATTCPRCGSAMVGVVRGSQTGLVLIIIGVVLTPVCIGIPIWVVGMIMRHGQKANTYFSCPRCNYSTG